MRDFSSIIKAHLPRTSTSTGGSAFQFTPDSQKLAIATAMSSHILLVDLSGGRPRVLRRFDHHQAHNLVGGDRVVKKFKSDWTTSMMQEERAKRKKAFENGQIDEGTDAVMVDGISEDESVTDVSRMAISADGQWLATSDGLARTYIFNLDSVQVSFLFYSVTIILLTTCYSTIVYFHLFAYPSNL
jgi:U3 small nucleolar RNA-associated protein 4